jgi:hypothetical protein
MKRLEVAEAIPNQTDEEKNAVARVKALVMHNSSRSADQSAFPRCGTGSCDEIRNDRFGYIPSLPEPHNTSRSH